MSGPELAGTAHAMPATRSASQLAARIPVPTRLPDRHDGEPLRHLSASSYALWLSCPDAWRRRYIKGEKPPTTGSMFLGSRVDDALSAYHRRILEHGDRLALDQLLDLYREVWHAELEAERVERGIEWDHELGERTAFELGRQAIAVAMNELVPHLGDPVDVQRRLEFSLAPGLEWTILCYLDLETLRQQHCEDPAPTVVDFKVKGSPIGQLQADSDPHAGLYLAGRWLEGYAASELLFAQIAKPGKRRKQMSTSLVGTTRTTGQLRGILARLALAASQIAAAHERYGPDRPWGFADPTSWKCSRRYCHAWAGCRAAAGSEARTSTRNIGGSAMTDWSGDEHELDLGERRWPMAPTNLLPRERWLWWDELWSDVVMLGDRYRVRPGKDWWEDTVQVEALAALAAWVARYDCGESDDPPGKRALLYDLERVRELARGQDPFYPDGDRAAFRRFLIESGCQPPSSGLGPPRGRE